MVRYAQHKRQGQQSLAGQRGFSLLELMYASGYFTIGLLILLSFQVVAANGVQRANALSLATNLASSVIEEMRVTPPQQILSGPQPRLYYFNRQGDAVLSESYFTVSATATPALGLLQAFDVVVETAWRDVSNPSYIRRIQVTTRMMVE